MGVSVNQPSLGVGQTWQDVTGSRALATTYTNTTGRAIEVSVRCSVIGGYFMKLQVGGIDIASTLEQGETTFVGVVPPGGGYRIDRDVFGSIVKWSELM